MRYRCLCKVHFAFGPPPSLLYIATSLYVDERVLPRTHPTHIRFKFAFPDSLAIVPFAQFSRMTSSTYPLPCLHPHSRNVSCIGCGSPRPHNGTTVQGTNSVPFVATRLASPRFASTSSAPSNVPSLRLNGTPSPTAMSYNIHPTLSSPLPYSQNQFKAPASQHPILTPSGRALAIGGKVQNVSSDPLAPCIMYWPDNEAFPEPGQIRPPNLANVHVCHAIIVLFP